MTRRRPSSARSGRCRAAGIASNRACAASLIVLSCHSFPKEHACSRSPDCDFSLLDVLWRPQSSSTQHCSWPCRATEPCRKTLLPFAVLSSVSATAIRCTRARRNRVVPASLVTTARFSRRHAMQERRRIIAIGAQPWDCATVSTNASGSLMRASTMGCVLLYKTIIASRWCATHREGAEMTVDDFWGTSF